MCGIAGLYNLELNTEQWQTALRHMGAALNHRGPDHRGMWFDEEARFGFVHQRLSIIGLSEQEHQPMFSDSGRFVIVYNGEVYNYREIAEQLQSFGVPCRTSSDTAVVLEAIETWGVEQALSRFIGMFAFALWDLKYLKLYLVRDRLGIKPLYYGWQNNVLFFTSDLQALVGLPQFNKQLDTQALDLYMQYGFIEQSHAIYQDMCKLPAGYLLTVDARSAVKARNKGKLKAYWQLSEVVRNNKNRFLGSRQEAVSELHDLLADAVKLQLVSDVPLGVFLSGGIDSSLVATMMGLYDPNMKTFSIGFAEESYNEAPYAKQVAEHLGTDHHECYLTAEQAQAIIPSMADVYSEPFADPSQIPTYLLAQFSKQHLKVALSGDGGDELFAGYKRYYLARDIGEKLLFFPRNIRLVMQKFILCLPTSLLNLFNCFLHQVFDRYGRPGKAASKIYKFCRLLSAGNLDDLYNRLLTIDSGAQDLLQHVEGKEYDMPSTLSQLNPIRRFMYTDMQHYLIDDILTKLDRATMAVSLEARVPLLDHRLIEFSWRLPDDFLCGATKEKYLLKQILKQYLPEKLVDRRKMGFAVPVSDWLRTGLRDWAESLLKDASFTQGGYFNAQQVLKKWQQHLSERRDWGIYFWRILMFQIWLNKQAK